MMVLAKPAVKEPGLQLSEIVPQICANVISDGKKNHTINVKK